MLYTGKGDNGATKLYGCDERMGKDDMRIEALGNVDELNSWVGLCAAQASGEIGIQENLQRVQEDLFIIQAVLAGAPKALLPSSLAFLESLIAEVEKEIPPIHSFTIPGATVLSAHLDVARTIARRAERSLVSLHDDSLAANVIPYLNRLSSALFALARLTAHRAGAQEISPTYHISRAGG